MSKYGKRYDWQKVNEYYQQGHTYRETKTKFGFAAASWSDAVKRGDVIPRITVSNLDKVLSGEIKLKSRHNLKQRILREKKLPYICTICGNIGEWNGMRLVLHLDHINGINDDDRLENLRFLCPNCHSQTDTYAGKSKGNGRHSRGKVVNR